MEVNLTGVPTEPVVGPVIETAKAVEIRICLELVVVWVFASVIVTETVNVPVFAYIVVKLAPVPEAGLPPVAVHANV